MRHHAKHHPSLAKEIEQLKSYKGLAAKAAQQKLAELEKRFAELKAQGREAEAYAEESPSIRPTIVKPSEKPAKAAEQPKAEEKKRRRK